MVLQSFESLKKRLSTTKQAPKRVVVANATDEHTVSAVMTLFKENMLMPTLVGDQSVIVPLLESLSISKEEIAKLDIIDVTGDEEIAFKAVSLIRDGLGDVLMKGHIQTRDLLKAVVNKETGIRQQKVLSHVAINEIPYFHKLLFLTDGGMMLTPDVAMKQEILKNVLSLTKQLGYETTYVALLDASENVNPKLQASLDAKEIKEAAKNGAFPDAVIEGPISLDLSLSKAIAKEKEYTSPVAGEADVLLVPDIVSGNLLGKSMVTFGKGQMAGLVLGATVPIIITSRGSTTEEKINSLMIACAI
ncbi:phosphate acyltransferase [Isobaculum melis]|uniref:Phosphate butyryltransferase n=1 Tax=Isobaculum melis TaxID=142588 RepID=A0A1H9TJL1_9LACT|nr:phosphate acyltransferase [Isobaculum melis]SER97184.1 phosphate butyryltransferase [Isobaculum melis]